MKHKYINKGKNDKNKYLNNPLVINNKKSKNLKISIFSSYNYHVKITQLYVKITKCLQTSAFKKIQWLK